MKRDKNYIKIFIANLIKAILIFFIVIGIWIGILFIKEGKFFRISILLIFIFIAIAVYCLMGIWKNWIIGEKCDFQAQETYILKLLNQKRYKNHIGLHLELLFTSLVLGKYEQCQQEINKLNGWDSRLHNMQRLQLQLWKIDYMISINQIDALKKEIENLEKFLATTGGIGKKAKQKIQRNINIRKYLIEKNWEDVLKLIENTVEFRKGTVFEQISIAYIQGICCYWLGRHEEAFFKLRLVEERGGNTKYVMLANDLIEKIPEKSLYEDLYVKQPIKYKINKEFIFLIMSCLCVLSLVWFNYYCSHGNSIEAIYCRRYLCAQDEITIFYQKNFGDYELIILSDNEKVAYLLFKDATGLKYKIVDSFRINKNMENEKIGFIGVEMTESETEFYQESEIKQELWSVIAEFYKNNSIFYQEGLSYVGISSSPMVKNITINGIPVTIEQIIETTETPVYLWSVKNIDLKTTIQVDYTEP